MIQLHPDYLCVKDSGGTATPVAAETLAFDVVTEAGGSVDPEIIRQAAAAVLYYFKSELGYSTVTLSEFATELERVLRAFGLNAAVSATEEPCLRLARYDLRALALDAPAEMELLFFPKLRTTVQRTLRDAPQVLQFVGLRGCVKLLLGARRWSRRCQAFSEEIVDFLRRCFRQESDAARCALVVR